MNLPKLAIDRPVFVSCIVILLMVLGLMSYSSLGVDLFPDVSFPFVSVITPYQGAAPQEIETQISKPLEEELSSLQGVKTVSSVNQEGFSTVFVRFTLETDAKYAEQQVRDRVAFVRPRLPKEIDPPVIRRYDPSDQAVAQLSLRCGLPPAETYDLADQVLKPQLSQVPGVGVVNLQGGRKREIRVELDRESLNRHHIGASQVAARIALNGNNVPVGKVSSGGKDLLFRAVGEYDDLERLKKTSVSFLGSDVSVPMEELGRVEDTVQDADGYSFVNGEPILVLQVFKQSKANTVAVVDDVLKRVEEINRNLEGRPGSPRLDLIQESARPVRLNLQDVKLTIFQGIFLTVLVVFLFLGSFRSTVITVTSLPVSILGAFILMNAEGFTLNVMTLLALSLAVGLLIDDAIVVRENIWRHIEEGMEPRKAAVEGALEVALAVVATSSVVIAVFLPIAFLKGTVGQFFRQFGLSVCFAMGISLFEAMVMGPMLSAYWARKEGTREGAHLLSRFLRKFDDFQTLLENKYEALIGWCLRHRLKVVLAALGVFLLSLGLGGFIKSTFLPAADVGEFMVFLKAQPGTSLEAMRDKALEVDGLIRRHPEVALTSGTVGGTDSTGTARADANSARIYVRLKHYSQRSKTTSDLKDLLRKELEPYHEALKPQVADFSAFGDWAPFNLNLIGEDYASLVPFAEGVAEKIKGIPGIADVQSTYDGGKPEFQAVLDPGKLRELGVSGQEAGMELRAQVEGVLPAKFRRGGMDYDIRVRLREDQRNIQRDFNDILVPNQNRNMVRLADVAKPVTTTGPAKINRQDRARYIQISGQLGPGGALGNILTDARKIMGGLKLPPGVSYEFVGQAEDYRDLGQSMVRAMALAILFTFMILASLYESPILPLTIMTSIPLSIVGALLALFLGGLVVPTLSLNVFSMISIVMLLGLVTKNSILLVDYALRMQKQGMARDEALKRAGKVRLRPILMTTFALIAGMLPLTLALTEVGKFRQSMGVAVEGGLISSLLLTLVIVPSVYGYVDDLRLWLRRVFGAGPEGSTPKK